ncbi:MAG: hypothetical protein AAFX80_14640 [Cyanobacteria bacterium J06639_18]
MIATTDDGSSVQPANVSRTIQLGDTVIGIDSNGNPSILEDPDGNATLTENPNGTFTATNGSGGTAVFNSTSFSP